MRLFIFGAGYSAQATAAALADQAEWVAGTTRNPDKLARLAEAGLRPVLFDGTMESLLAGGLADATHLLVSAGPDEAGDPLLALLDGPLRDLMPALHWIGYFSTIGVYGDHDGAWIDEDTPCKPTSQRSVERCAVEKAWMEAGAKAGLPVAILRLSGIYGPGRNAFCNLDNGTARRLVKPGQVFNRIHVDDIAGATAHLAAQSAGGIFNVTDNEPAPPQDVVAFAAELMGVTPPPETDFATAELSPMARSFYGENKRASNARIKAAGYDFAMPDYRAALTAMWHSGNWR